MAALMAKIRFRDLVLLGLVILSPAIVIVAVLLLAGIAENPVGMGLTLVLDLGIFVSVAVVAVKVRQRRDPLPTTREQL